MQRPTPGRIVIVRVAPEQNSGYDEAPAIVTRVLDTDDDARAPKTYLINVLAFLDATGGTLPMTSVRLVKNEDDTDEGELNVAWWPAKA